MRVDRNQNFKETTPAMTYDLWPREAKRSMKPFCRIPCVTEYKRNVYNLCVGGSKSTWHVASIPWVEASPLQEATYCIFESAGPCELRKESKEDFIV